MLKIRLQRTGRKHEPTFRVVLTDSKNSTKSGRFNEILGSYDPRIDSINLKADRIKYWMDNGAQLTDSIHNILINQKLIEGKKKNVLSKKSPIVKEPTEEEKAQAEAVAKQAEAPATESPKEEPVAEAPAEPAPAETTEAPAEEKPAEVPAEEAPKEEVKE